MVPDSQSPRCLSPDDYDQQEKEVVYPDEHGRSSLIHQLAPSYHRYTRNHNKPKEPSMGSDALESSSSSWKANRKSTNQQDEIHGLIHDRYSKNEEEGEEEDDEDTAPPWTPEMHRSFVEAIFTLGMSHASPAVIMEYMTLIDTSEQGGRKRRGSLTDMVGSQQPSSQNKEKMSGVTNERVKSHWQKFRKNSEKSKSEFMLEYDAWMRKALTIGGAASRPTSSGTISLLHPSTVVQIMGGDEGRNDSSNRLGGERAAWLSYATLSHEFAIRQKNSAPSSRHSLSSQQPSQAQDSESGAPREAPLTLGHFRQGAGEYLDQFSGANVPYPVLSEAERMSPLGTMIQHVMELFSSMTQHLIRLRLQSVGLAANSSEEAPEAPSGPPSKRGRQESRPEEETKSQEAPKRQPRGEAPPAYFRFDSSSTAERSTRPHPLEQDACKNAPVGEGGESRKRRKLVVDHHDHSKLRPPQVPTTHHQPPNPGDPSVAYMPPQRSRPPPGQASTSKRELSPVADHVMAAVVQRALQAERDEEHHHYPHHPHHHPRVPPPIAAYPHLADGPPHHHHPQHHHHHPNSQIPQFPTDNMTQASQHTDLSSIDNIFDFL